TALTQSSDHVLHLWDIESMKEIHRWVCSGVTSVVCFSADSRSVLMRIDGESHWTTWDMAAGRESVAYEKVKDRVGLSGFSSDGREAVETIGSELRILDILNNNYFKIFKYENKESPARVVAGIFSPDLRRLLQTFNNGYMIIYNLVDGDVR